MAASGRFETLPPAIGHLYPCVLTQVSPADLDIPILGQLVPGAASGRRCLRTGSAGGSMPRRTSRAWAALDAGAGTGADPRRYGMTSRRNSLPLA
jgi:hypothetical protein